MPISAWMKVTGYGMVKVPRRDARETANPVERMVAEVEALEVANLRAIVAAALDDLLPEPLDAVQGREQEQRADVRRLLEVPDDPGRARGRRTRPDDEGRRAPDGGGRRPRRRRGGDAGAGGAPAGTADQLGRRAVAPAAGSRNRSPRPSRRVTPGDDRPARSRRRRLARRCWRSTRSARSRQA